MKIIRFPLVVTLAFPLLLVLAACGGGSSSGGDSDGSPHTAMVTALYSANGADWNDYVSDDGGDSFSASDTACDPDIHTACLHGGEMRALVVTAKTSCIGLSASDALGAFDWACDSSTSPVRMVTTGLAREMNLSDLLDFGTPGWKLNSVTAYSDGAAYLTTENAVWWNNPVMVDNDGGYLDDAGTIYVVTNDTLDISTGGYIINASSVGLVGLPGTIINGPAGGAGSHVIEADGSTSARDFLWMEGSVDAAGDDAGVYLDTVRFSILRDVTANNSDTGTLKAGFFLYNASKNTLSAVKASNSRYGVFISSSSDNTLSEVTVSNNGDTGVYLDSSYNNTLYSVTAANNGVGILLVSVADTVLSGITASNNFHSGIILESNVDSTILAGVTSSNNGFGGVVLGFSSFNTLSGVTAANNGVTGVGLFGSSNNTVSGVTGANNGVYGISLENSSSNYFTGPLKVGGNLTSDCFVKGGTDPGLVDSTCDDQGPSDAALTNGVSLDVSFVGKLNDDAVNASDTGGAVSYPADPAAFDWLNFENAFRGWGKDGALGDAGSRGSWYMGEGRIWDWSLLSTDMVILDALSLPTGDDTLVHLWSDATTTTFLRNAVEIQGDGLGNDNTLCESGEICLYTPNIASYQGHGDLVSSGPLTDGTLTGITLMKYGTNGR